MSRFKCPEDISSDEAGVGVGKHRRGPKKKVRGVAGLRLGCKPFQSATKLYLEETIGLVKESTWKERRKKLNFIGRVLGELYSAGKVSTLDPRHLTTMDIQMLKAWMMDQNYDPSTQKKWLTELKKMLEHYENYVFIDLKRKGFKMPTDTDKPIRSFKESDLSIILAATERLPNRWHGQMMRGAMAIYWATMRRPSEIRLCRLKDLDLASKTLHIEYPKGGGSWAGPTEVSIVRDNMLPLIHQYLDERREHLEQCGYDEAEALFPNLTRGPDGIYSMSKFNEIKRMVEKEAGIKFLIKDFRSSSTGAAMDIDLKLLPVVSTQLGHKDPSTTLKYNSILIFWFMILSLESDCRPRMH